MRLSEINTVPSIYDFINHSDLNKLIIMITNYNYPNYSN